MYVPYVHITQPRDGPFNGLLDFSTILLPDGSTDIEMVQYIHNLLGGLLSIPAPEFFTLSVTLLALRSATDDLSISCNLTL